MAISKIASDRGAMEGIVERSAPKHGGQILEVCGSPRTTENGDVFVAARMIEAGKSEHSDLRGETVDLYLNPTLGEQNGRKLSTVMAAVARASDKRAKKNSDRQYDPVTFATRIEAQGELHTESTPQGDMTFFVASRVEEIEAARVVNPEVVKRHTEKKRKGSRSGNSRPSHQRFER